MGSIGLFFATGGIAGKIIYFTGLLATSPTVVVDTLLLTLDYAASKDAFLFL